MKVDDLKPQPPPAPEIRAGAHSAKGLRDDNQDSMTRFHSRLGEVILVADGMGGHLGGAVASDMVAQRFRVHLDAAVDTTPSIADALQQAAMRVNDEIHERGHSGDAAVAGMGSTLVVAVLRWSPAGQEVTVANAGDSRAYLVRDGALRQLTKDHTAAQRMVDAGLISQADARSHPQGSVLSRALGQQIGTTVETYPPLTLQPGDGLLLCSDGLSGFALDADIAAAIGSTADPNVVVRNLIDLALQKGSDDNITVQFLRLAGGVPPMPVAGGAAAAPAPAEIVRPRKRSYLGIIILVIGIVIAGSVGFFLVKAFRTARHTRGGSEGSRPHTGSPRTASPKPASPQPAPPQPPQPTPHEGDGTHKPPAHGTSGQSPAAPANPTPGATEPAESQPPHGLADQQKEPHKEPPKKK